MIAFIQRLSYFFDKVSRFIIIWFFISAFVAILYSVLSRYVLQSSLLSTLLPQVNFAVFNLTWIEELIRYLFIWVIFLGIGSVYKLKAHAQVELLLNFLSGKWKNIFGILIEIVNCSFFMLLFYQVWNMLIITKSQLSPSLKINMAWVYISILCCSIICCLHSLSHLVNYIHQKSAPKQPFSEDKIAGEGG